MIMLSFFAFNFNLRRYSVALQYSIMPLLGLAVGRLFPIAQPFAVGLILVGCCPGGMALHKSFSQAVDLSKGCHFVMIPHRY